MHPPRRRRLRRSWSSPSRRSSLVGPPASAAGTWTWPVVGPGDPGVRSTRLAVRLRASGHRHRRRRRQRVAVAPPTGACRSPGRSAGGCSSRSTTAGGLESTYSWVSALRVAQGRLWSPHGQPVAVTGGGHTGDPLPNLHIGVKLARRLRRSARLPRTDRPQRPYPAGAARRLSEASRRDAGDARRVRCRGRADASARLRSFQPCPEHGRGDRGAGRRCSRRAWRTHRAARAGPSSRAGRRRPAP